MSSAAAPVESTTVAFELNGAEASFELPVRWTLADLLRDRAGLTGTHLGCEHGVCGACTILVDGRTARACLMLAVQADDADIRTVEGLARDGALHPLQQAFWDHHALQCGYCTPGMLMAACELLEANPDPTDAEIREAIAGNICRCTGYVHIVRAIRAAAAALRGAST
jgi:carbon-monoxide dehydrogenase small subunit